MNKQYFVELASYNVWANDIVKNWIDHIDNRQWTQTIVSSFPSLSETVLHILGAESIWLERLNKTQNPVWLPFVFEGNKDETVEKWLKASNQLKSFVESLKEEDMEKEISFKRVNGEAVEMSVFQILSHVFNHSTYHRGQIVTILRQVGYDHVTSTDLMGFYRIK